MEDKEAKIKKQAKAIMDEFMAALEEVKEIDGVVGIERKQSTRIPKARNSDSDFIKAMFKNAPKSKDKYLVAEKKQW